MTLNPFRAIPNCLTSIYQGAVMIGNKYSVIKNVVMAAALAAGASGVANADDSSMSRFGGDSYAFFNSQPVNEAPSTWRQANPTGLSERELQAVSSEGPAWQLTQPVFASAPSTFRQDNPHGLSERELQALSSEGPAWQLPNESRPTANVAQSSDKVPLSARIASFFHPASNTSAGMNN
jgi:hypothetical protein